MFYDSCRIDPGEIRGRCRPQLVLKKDRDIFANPGPRADFLLQKRTLDDIVLVRAAAGDLVYIPPGYGHVTINPSLDETLTMANLVSTRFESEYGEYERLQGVAYYELIGERLVKKPRYPPVPEIRVVGASKCPLP